MVRVHKMASAGSPKNCAQRGGFMAHSDAWLKANNNKARPGRAEFSDRDGLGVRVTPKGKIVFQER